jgi:hypothetical protein
LRWCGFFVVCGLVCGGAFAAPPAIATLTVRIVNTDGQGVSSRSAPRNDARNGYGAPEGATVMTNCWTWGDSVGPYNNRLWWLITYSGRQFYVADRYLSTPNRANQPPGSEPQCGSAPATPPPPQSSSSPPPQSPPPSQQSSSSLPAVWIGSPIDGTWGKYESSLPANHHIPYGGDWSVDLVTGAGNAVMLYAAPQETSRAITAKVDSVRPACKSGVVSDGGHVVVVGIYEGGTRIGWAAYAHINPSVSTGQTISRWGTNLGTIGTYRWDDRPEGCWAGAHVHFEAYNQRNYACYNRGYGLGSRVNRTNFIGFVGGDFARSKRAACP